MSYLSQSIRNRFPSWSAIRREDSSNGAKIIDVFAFSLENLRNDYKKLYKQEPSLYCSPTYEPGHIFYTSLENQEEFVNYYRDNKDLESIFINANQGIELNQYDTYEELVSSLPDRIDVNLLKTKECLIVETEEKEIESSFFLDKEGENIYIDLNYVNNFITSVSQPYFNNETSITLRGKNSLFDDIEETIIIKNTGMYKSKNRFTSLEKIEKQENISGGNVISIVGLEGAIRFFSSPKKIFGKEIKDKILVNKYNRLEDRNGLDENYLFVELREEEDNFYLDYIYRYYESGIDYKKEESLEGIEHFEDLLFSQIILDINGEKVKVEDFWWDEVKQKIIVIDAEGIIYYYNLNKHFFTEPRFSRSKNITFIFEAINQQVALNETSEIFVFLERPKGPIYNYCILLEKPNDESDEYENFLFLNENKEFQNEISFFKAKDHLDVFENVDSFKFDVNYNEIGQYNFYIISFRIKEDMHYEFENNNLTKNELLTRIQNRIEDNYETDIHVNRLSIYCEFLKPEKSFNTNLLEGNYSLYKEGPENNLYCIKTENNIDSLYVINEYTDGFLFNYSSGELAVLNEYESLSININSSLNIEFNFYDEMTKYRNSTSLDELGVEYKLLRGQNERLNDYYKRIYKCVLENYKYHKNSFYNSLGFATELQEIIICRIKPIETEIFLLPNIIINDTNLIVTEGTQEVLNVSLKEKKFLVDIFEELNNLNLFEIEILKNNYEYLKSEYLIPCNAYRAINNMLSDDYVTRLPKKYINSVTDFNGNFLYNKNDAEYILNENSYVLEENVLTKFNRGEERLHVEYYDYPLIIKWSPIKSYEIYKDSFNKITHDGDENLTQDGAKIYNMILEKQNTYWGK